MRKLLDQIHRQYKVKRIYKASDYLRLVNTVFDRFGRADRLHGQGGVQLRHDVDRDIFNALHMARFECLNEIQSTYFVLHTSDYYVKPQILDEIALFENWGHEVGLHNDVLSVHHVTGEPWRDILKRELDFLRDGGIDVVGTSSHGSKEAYEYGFVNHDIFGIDGPKIGTGKDVLGSDTAVDEPIELPSREWGLEYEAYGLAGKCDWYVSDSGGKFTMIDVKNERLYGGLDINLAIDFLEGLSGTIQLLVHPMYYDFG